MAVPAPPNSALPQRPTRCVIAMLLLGACTHPPAPPPDRPAALDPTAGAPPPTDESSPASAPPAPALTRTLSRRCAIERGRVWCEDVVDRRLADAHASTSRRDRQPIWKRIRELTDTTSLACGEKFCCALDSGGGIGCFGDNHSGQIGDPYQARAWGPHSIDLPPARAVFAGPEVACALVDDRLACWGASWSGKDATPRRSAQPAWIEGLPAVVDVALGKGHACARTAAGELWCWGRGLEGQLGPSHLQQVVAPFQLETTAPADLLRAGDALTAYSTTDGNTHWLGQAPSTFNGVLEVDPFVVDNGTTRHLLWREPDAAYQARAATAADIDDDCMRDVEGVLTCLQYRDGALAWGDRVSLNAAARRDANRDPRALTPPVSPCRAISWKSPGQPTPMPDLPTCSDGVVSPGEACEGRAAPVSSCSALGLRGGTPSCRKCMIDAGACDPCGTSVVCHSRAVGRLPGGQPVLTAAAGAGRTAVAFTGGFDERDRECHPVSMALVRNNGELESPHVITQAAGAQRLALVGLDGAWLVAIESEPGVAVHRIDARGRRSSPLTSLADDRAPMWIEPRGAAGPLLYVQPAKEGRASSPRVVLFDPAGNVVGEPVDVWAALPGGYLPATGTATDNGFVLARNEVGFDRELAIGVVEITRAGEISGRAYIGKATGEVVAVESTPGGYRVWALDGDAFVEITVHEGTQTRRTLGGFPVPRRRDVLPSVVHGSQRVGEHLHVLLHHHGALTLVDIDARAVSSWPVRADGMEGPGALTRIGTTPTVVWGSARYRMPPGGEVDDPVAHFAAFFGDQQNIWVAQPR